MKENFTDITVLLDKSGSMVNMKSEVISGFNSFLKRQKETSGEAVITLIEFDKCDIHNAFNGTVYTAKPINEAPILNKELYVPCGMTPLRDALGMAIKNTGDRLSSMDEKDRPSKVIFMIITDGYENASSEYSQIQVKEMTEHQTNVYNWDFIFLGANIDSFAQGNLVGIKTVTIADFSSNNVVKAFNMTSDKVSNYRISGQKSDLAYTNNERKSLINNDKR